MTQKQAKSELEAIYMSLSEEKKEALDVAFKAMEQADNIPVMYYPQVDGITPTVVAQADGEYILKKDVMGCIGQTSLHWELARKLRKLPSVAIPNKVGHWEYNQYDGNPNIGNWHCSECRNIVSDMPTCMGKPLYEFCPNCGCPMEIER